MGEDGCKADRVFWDVPLVIPVRGRGEGEHFNARSVLEMCQGRLNVLAREVKTERAEIRHAERVEERNVRARLPSTRVYGTTLGQS